jgi:DeoR/GlpR family transcriptional regulator of sugar metabolism
MAQMPVDQRRSRLLELIQVRGFASLPELANQLEVSESTVRRDLDFLEESGAAKRTHGGAFYTGASPKLPHFDQRQATNWEKKRQIGRAACRLIDDADTVLLDGGSTTYELAQLLVGRPLQIVTNSLPVANLFTASPSTDLVLVGGVMHHRTGVLLGQYAQHMLSELSVRRAMLSVASVSQKGFYNSNLLIVEAERAMMEAADDVIVLADSTKFGHQSLSQLCELGGIDRLVVDSGITPEWRDRVEAAGVEVIVAPDDSESEVETSKTAEQST